MNGSLGFDIWVGGSVFSLRLCFGSAIGLTSVATMYLMLL